MTQPIAPELKGAVKHLNSRQAAPDKENLKAQLAALASQVAEIELEEVQQQEQQRTEATKKYQELRADAESYRVKAQQAISQKKKEQFEAQMFECLEAAENLAEEFPFLSPQPPEQPVMKTEKKPVLSHRVIACLQMIAVIGAIWLLKWYFEQYQADILATNKMLPAEQHVSPYDASSLQKLVFEKLALFTDLPFALIVLTLIVPFVGFYLLPFLKARKDFHTEFYEELTPWQRSIITTCFVLGLLFVFALSHLVKP